MCTMLGKDEAHLKTPYSGEELMKNEIKKAEE